MYQRQTFFPIILFISMLAMGSAFLGAQEQSGQAPGGAEVPDSGQGASGSAGSAAAAPALMIFRVGFVLEPQLAFGESWDPGAGGTRFDAGFEIPVLAEGIDVRVDTGLAGRFYPGSTVVYAKAGARLGLVKQDWLALSWGAGVDVGAALYRPDLLAVLGIDTDLRADFALSRGFGLYLGAGLSWLACPAYQANYGWWNTVTVPVSAGIEFCF